MHIFYIYLRDRVDHILIILLSFCALPFLYCIMHCYKDFKDSYLLIAGEKALMERLKALTDGLRSNRQRFIASVHGGTVLVSMSNAKGHWRQRLRCRSHFDHQSKNSGDKITFIAIA